MYLTDFVCTYKLHEDSEKDDIYRLQFLQAFCLDNWDDDAIEKKTTELYNTVTQKVDCTDIFEKVKKSDKYKFILQFVGDDNYAIFKILFMYDLFDLAHKCFCDILNKGIINIDNKNMLLNNI